MITEDYVSLETAKLLKKKGFNCEKQYISAMYDEDGDFYSLLTTSELGGYDYEDFDDKDFIAPTLQMAMKWLREEHNLFVQPTVGETEGKTWYDFDIIPVNGKVIYWKSLEEPQIIELSSPEEACEAAIKYCLENLI